MILGYARVSTDKADQDVSIDEQVLQLKAAGCDRVIAERRSAHQGIRPGWEELQGLVAAGKVRRVVAISLSRLSRQGEDVPFLRMCARRGVEVQLLDGTPADTADPAGKLLTGVLSLVNEVDSDIKSRNVRNGLARRKAQGHYACGRVPFGYLYDGSRVVPHPDNFAAARQLWEQLEAMEFNIPGAIRRHGLQWSSRGLGRWVNNPILRGVIGHEPGRVEALITWEEWQRCRQLIESRQVSRTRAPRTIQLLSGLMRCAACNRRMHYAHAHGKYRMKCTNLHCRWWGRGLAEWKVRGQVIDALRGAADRMATIAAAPAAPEPRPQDTEKRQQIAQLEALAAQGVPGLGPTIEALRLELLAPPAVASADWAGCRDLLLRPGVLEGASMEELRAVLLELVAEIVYVGNADRVEVRLRDCPSEDPA